MEQIRKFLRDKGFCTGTAGLSGGGSGSGDLGGAHRARRAGQEPFGPETTDSTSTAPGIDEGLSTTTPQEDETTWEWPTEPAANSVSNVPKVASSASRSASSASSVPQAGSGSVREPSALQGASSPAPAVRQRLLPRSRSLAGCSMDTAAMSWSQQDPGRLAHPQRHRLCLRKGCCRPEPHGGHGGAGRFRWQLGPHCGDQGQCGPCLAALRRGQPGGEGGRDGQCRADIGQSGQRQL